MTDTIGLFVHYRPVVLALPAGAAEQLPISLALATQSSSRQHSMMLGCYLDIQNLAILLLTFFVLN